MKTNDDFWKYKELTSEDIQKLQALDLSGFPSLAEVTKEVMRVPDLPQQRIDDLAYELMREEDSAAGRGPARYEKYLQSAGDLSFSTQVVQASDTLILDSMSGLEDRSGLEEDCQSGPSDLAWERRQRDRSGNKPKVRKWKARQKTRAARKARRINR